MILGSYPSRNVVFVALLGLSIPGGAGPIGAQSLPNGASATWAISDALAPESRQFDFWVGQWDVNLRVRQEDLSWIDTHRAVVRIYPILEGKAVLELWDSEHIRGMSLRYFDVDKAKWVLWLNWPEKNRSGSSSLEGAFRHGRGDFYSTRVSPDGTESISRYSFNDITPTSLRWDDAYSNDKGKTWTNSWIMEFSRTADVPTLRPGGGPDHTFRTGELCSDEQFRTYEFLSGQFQESPNVSPRRGGSAIGYRVLDGCALLLFFSELDAKTTETADHVAHITWNTYANRFELLMLDGLPESASLILYSGPDAEHLVFTRPQQDTEDGHRVTIEGDASGFRWLREIDDGQGWTEVERRSFLPTG